MTAARQSNVRAAIVLTAGASVISAGLTVLTTPLFVRTLGIEAYALIGVFTTIMTLCSVLDLGIGLTLTRQASAIEPGTSEHYQLGRVAAALEMITLGIGAALAGGVILGAPLLVRYWLKPGTLAETEIITALRAGAITIACQFPAIVYAAGLAGRQRFVLLSLISIPFAVLRSFGILAVLWLTSPSVAVFFAMMAALMVAQTGLMRVLFWREIGTPGASAKTAGAAQAPILTFWLAALPTGLISISGIILTQADRVIASKLLPLDQLGYYLLAAALVNGIGLIVAPIGSTTYPRLANLATSGRMPELTEVYHAATQLVAVVAVPVAVVLCLFSGEALGVWTSNPAAVANGKTILSVLAAAGGIGGILSLLLSLELAQGRTAPAIGSHLVSIAVLVPVAYTLVSWYGPVGAAMSWLCHNIGMLLVRPPITHRRLPRRDLIIWYTQDIVPAAGLTIAAGLVARLLIPFPQDRVFQLATLMAIWSVLLVVAALAAWRVRGQFLALAPAASAIASAARGLQRDGVGKLWGGVVRRVNDRLE